MMPNINFNKPVYAGQVLLNNILCAAFNFQYYDSVFTNSYRYIQAVFFDKKWFLTSQGNNLAYVTSVPINGKISLYGTDGKTLYRLYSDTVNTVSSIVQTALLPMEDSIRTKQALKIAIEATATNYIATLNTTVDSEIASSPTIVLSNGITWTNATSVAIGWVNNSLLSVGWASGNNLGTGYIYLKNDAQQYGKYLGMTVKSTSPSFVLNGFEFEHELRVRF
jgi:hypothetical protein